MPRELYNEGRVVGYSAYELYVKHALSEFPDDEPASERQWLAAQLGNGSSLIVKIPIEALEINGPHYIDIPLPENTKLLTANTIIGSQFFGECEFGQGEYSSNWAIRVSNYGTCISNNSQSYPNTSQDARSYPTQPAKLVYSNLENNPTTLIKDGEYAGTYSQNTDTGFLQYLKIQDGVILQPGIWQDAELNGKPEKDFIPDYHGLPVLRISLASRITTEFYVLLTGFTHRSIIAGVSGIDTGSTNTLDPENGDFLGPEVYPWANKVIFMQAPVSEYFRHQYLASGHQNLRDINQPDDLPEGSDIVRKDNLRIDNDENDVNTIFTSSYLYSSPGISIEGPLTPGGDIHIGAKIGSVGEAQNYLEIKQTHSDSSNKQVTDIKHSEINAGFGVAYHKPKIPGEEVEFSSMIATANNYLKVEQISKPDLDKTSINASTQNNKILSSELTQESNGYTTLLSASEFISNGGVVDIQGPSNPGDPVKFNSEITSDNPNYLKVESSNGVTTLYPATINSGKIKDDDPDSFIVIKQPQNPGDDIQICIDWDNFFKGLTNKVEDQKDFKAALLKYTWGAIQQILSKIGDGTSTLATDLEDPYPLPNNTGELKYVQWGDMEKPLSIPVGNMNVYSSTDGSDTNANRFIKCHKSAQNGDLRVN